MFIDYPQAQQADAGAATPVNQKKEYKSPVLVCYGSVSILTRAAATGNSEGGGSMNPTMAASDVRLKQNIARIGNHSLGFGLYLFDYKPEFRGGHGAGRQFGVMAQEVEAVMPSAVVTYADGFKRVNYAMLGIDCSVRRVH